MRSVSEISHRGRALPRILALVALLALPVAARAETMTFHLSVRDTLASVDRYNAFLVSLGKSAKGVKLVQGGTTFADQSCAAFGTVFRLESVAILAQLSALGAEVPSRSGKSAMALTAVFNTAGVRTWTPPPAEAQTDLAFWAPVPFTGGLKFEADPLSGDAGLLGSDSGDHLMRFRVDVNGTPDAAGRYRFLLELSGKTSSNDGALVVKGERRCFTFVDLAPVDLAALNALVDTQVSNPNLNASMKTRLAAVGIALDHRDTQGALDTLAVFVSSVVSGLDSLDPAPVAARAKARLLSEAAFGVRRDVLFIPATSVCGNGQRETGEACDGGDLGGFSCTTLSFQSGTLACGPDCRFVTSGCVNASVCGNGILEAGEQCDNGSANSDTVPDACRTNCVFAYCGDGVIDSFEECEGKNLNGETCFSLGYEGGGKLACDPQECAFDDTNCIE